MTLYIDQTGSLHIDPAGLILAVSVAFILYALVRLFLMYRKRGPKPWSPAQRRFGWRAGNAFGVVSLSFYAAWLYVMFNSPLTSFWPAALLIAFLFAYVPAMNWYERRLFALADAS